MFCWSSLLHCTCKQTSFVLIINHDTRSTQFSVVLFTQWHDQNVKYIQTVFLFLLLPPNNNNNNNTKENNKKQTNKQTKNKNKQKLKTYVTGKSSVVVTYSLWWCAVLHPCPGSVFDLSCILSVYLSTLSAKRNRGSVHILPDPYYDWFIMLSSIWVLFWTTSTMLACVCGFVSE